MVHHPQFLFFLNQILGLFIGKKVINICAVELIFENFDRGNCKGHVVLIKVILECRRRPR